MAMKKLTQSQVSYFLNSLIKSFIFARYLMTVLSDAAEFRLRKNILESFDLDLKTDNFSEE